MFRRSFWLSVALISVLSINGHTIGADAIDLNEQIYIGNWSPSGFAVHSVGADPEWVFAQWFDNAKASHAGYIRMTIPFSSFWGPYNGDGAYPVIPTMPGVYLNLASVDEFNGQTLQLMRNGMRVIWTALPNADNNEPAKFLMKTFLEHLPSSARQYLTIEYSNEPNLAVFWHHTTRPLIDGDPESYVDFAIEFYDYLKPLFPQVTFIAGATVHFGPDYQCGDHFPYPTGGAGCPGGVGTPGGYPDEEAWSLGYLHRVLSWRPELGGLLNHVDGISAHPYRMTSAPERGFITIPGSDPEGFVHEVRKWVAAVEGHKPFGKQLVYHFTEYGYSSCHKLGGVNTGNEMACAGSLQIQADYLSRSVVLLLHETLLAKQRLANQEPDGYHLESFNWNTLKDDCRSNLNGTITCFGPEYENQEYTAGVATWDNQPKKSFAYYQRIAEELRGRDLEAVDSSSAFTIASTTSTPTPGQTVQRRLFRRKDGAGWIVALWTPETPGGTVNVEVNVAPRYSSIDQVDLEVPGSTNISGPSNTGMTSVPVTVSNHVTLLKIRTRLAATSDYDGDGKTDVSVWTPSTEGRWSYKKSTGGVDPSIQWGTTQFNDHLVAADYDGDGRTDPAVWRPSTGQWYILKSTEDYREPDKLVIQWGNGMSPYNDIPVPGDYDGDGKSDPAVWRQATADWFVLKSTQSYNPASQLVKHWGSASLGDIPVPADYDGDGKTDMAVWRASTGEWFVLTSSSGFASQLPTVTFGSQALQDVPLAGDVDGDGRADLVVYRSGTWYVCPSTNNYSGAWAYNLGTGGEFPALGDLDGNGRSDLFTYAGGIWKTLNTTSGASGLIPWGLSTDWPALRYKAPPF